MTRRATWFGLLGAPALLAMIIAGGWYGNSEMRWRLTLVAMKAAGGIHDLGWSDLLHMLMPDSGLWLQPLVREPNPFAVINSPFSTQHDIDTGRILFRYNCESCHGHLARGGVAPSLSSHEFKHGSSDWAIFLTIRDGVPGTPMPAHAMTDGDLWRLVTFVRSLNVIGGASTEAADVAELDVQPERMSAARGAAGDWPTYFGSYNGQRHSSLALIDRGNVSQLAARWIYQLPTKNGRIETTPIEADGRLFVTNEDGAVSALDAATGALLWRFARPRPAEVKLCCVVANRGVAILHDAVYVATVDAHLIALDSATGKLRWDVVVADYGEGYSSTGAPLAVKDMIVTGIAGSEFGVRGFVAAYDAKTGAQLWRTYTIPGPGEPGHETWASDSWKHGGASTWMTGTYDPGLDLLYWGVANAAPDYDASVRAGDNLYSNSVLALHAASGQIAWHFQYSPGDDHDWDSVQTPVLADLSGPDGPRKLLLAANRNGFFYVLDRTNGRFLQAVPFVRQNWAERIDSAGRPVRRLSSAPSPRGALVYPGTAGGTNWSPPSYDPQSELFLVPALERAGIYFKSQVTESEAGETYLAGSSSGAGSDNYLAIRALDPRTGELRWEHRSRIRHSDGSQCGLLSTGGGLVFGSDRSRLLALDVADGRLLWSFEAGGKIISPPSTYLAGRDQVIVFAAGSAVIALTLPPPPIAPARTQK